ncbi:MAG: FAD-dependent oxidoreductase [Oceanipulchritudo sp.]
MLTGETIRVETCILGGGFGGIACAKALSHAARTGKVGPVGLIAAENHMVFQPMLPEVASGALSPRHVVNPIRQLCRGIEVFKGSVHRIDPDGKTLFLHAGDFTPQVRVEFNRLVVALGAQIDLSRVPGMSEHALLMQNVGDAMRVRATVIGRFEEANLVSDPDLQQRLLTFVVVGGGYSGVETAGGLVDMFQGLLPYYQNIQQQACRIYLIHSRDRLLPTLDPQLGEYTRRILESKGMRVLLNERVLSMTSRSVTLGNESVIECATVISTIGNAPHPLVMELANAIGLEPVRGRLPAQNTGRVPGFDWLWACGDCALIPLADGSPSPPTAQYAQRQGRLVGANILASAMGKPMRPFRFNGLGELAAIGHQRAVGKVLGIRMTGFFPWWLWRTVYLAKLPGFQRKIKVAADWTFELFFQRDINLLSPRYTKVLKEILLEPDTVLFNPGDPAFSLYFVQSGQIDILEENQLVKRVEEGEYFGERAILDNRIWPFRAVAKTRSRLIALGAPEFETILGSSHALHQLFSRSSGAYMRTAEVERFKTHLVGERRKLPIESIMNRQVNTIPGNACFAQAMDIVRKHRHGSYPVVADGGRLMGVLSRDSFYDRIKRNPDLRADSKLDIPLTTLPVAQAGTSVDEVLNILLHSGKNKVCITDSYGRLLGLATLMDLVESHLISGQGSSQGPS